MNAAVVEARKWPRRPDELQPSPAERITRKGR